VVIDIVEREGKHRIAGLLARDTPRGARCLGYEVVGTSEDLAALIEGGVSGVLIAIGDNSVRANVAAEVEGLAPTVEFATAVHPSAQIARGVRIGAGSVIMAGAILNSNASMGRHCILNTKASLDHNSVLGDFASLGPGATVGGIVQIGEYSAVAMGATVKHGVRIGVDSVIGGGATVLGDIPDGVVAYGTPAKVVRWRGRGERYL